MKNVYREKRRLEYDGSSDNRLDIQRFEIRKHNHKEFTEIEENLIPGTNRHIGYRRDGMTDDIDSHDEKYGKERRDKGREKENDGEKKEEFQIDKSDRHEKKNGEGGLRYEKYGGRYDGLYEKNKKENSTETEKFSKDEISSGNGFREDQIDGFSFDFPKKELTSDENHRHDSENLDHRESEIGHDFFGLTERKRCKYERKSDEGDSEEHDHIENLVSGEFPESIECDIEHKIGVTFF